MGSIRAIWPVRDGITLDASEAKAAESKREMVAVRAWRGTLNIRCTLVEETDASILAAPTP